MLRGTRWIALVAAVVVPSSLAAQWAQVTFQTPADGAVFTTTNSVAVQYKGCSDNVAQTSWATRIGSTNFSTSQASTGVTCFDVNTARRYNATVTLNPGSNVIVGEICNNTQSPACYNASITVTYNPVASVTVTNNGATTLGVGQTTTLTARTLRSDGSEVTGMPVTWTTSGGISLSSSSGNSPMTVTVTATSASSASASAASLGSSGGSNVTVVNPTYSASIITTHNHPLNLSAGATGTGQIRFRIQNTSQYVTGSQTFDYTVSRSGIVTSCNHPGSTQVSLPPGETSDFITVSNCSIGATTAPTSGTIEFDVSTSGWSGEDLTTVNATPLFSIAVSQPSPVTHQARATSGTVTFTVSNNSVNVGGSTQISLSRLCQDVATCGPLGPPNNSVTIAEGNSTNVALDYGVNLTGTTGTVRLTASAGGVESQKTVNISTTPDYKVIITRTAVDTTLGGGASGASARFTVTNNSTNTGTTTQYSFTGTCSGPFVTGCNGTPAAVTLGDQTSTATGAVSLSYFTGSVGTSGTVKLKASASSPGVQSDSATTTVYATPVYAVSVQMQTPNDTLAERTTLDTARFRIQNTSTNTSGAPIGFTVNAVCSPVATCNHPQEVISLAEGALSGWRDVVYNVIPVGTSGAVTVSAVSTPAQSTGVSNLYPRPDYTVELVPGLANKVLDTLTSASNASFTIRNTSANTAGPITFSLTPTCGGVATCITGQTTLVVAQGADSVRSVSFSVDSVGTTGSVVAIVGASSPKVIADTGATTLLPTPHYRVAVTPASTPQQLGERVTGGKSGFIVRNTSWNVPTGAVTFTMVPTCTAIARPASCAVTAGTLALAQNAASVDTVIYSVDSIGTSGSAALRAYATTPTSFEKTGTTNLNATASYRIAVVPGDTSLTVGAGTTQTFNATIKNTSWNTANSITASLAASACSNVKLGSCSLAANSTALAQGQSTGPIGFTYDAIATGTEPTIALNASGSVSGGTVGVTNGTLGVTVSTSGTIAATTAGLNPGTTIDRGGCVAIAAGQNAAYECGDLRVVHQLPTTITMNKAQAPTLIYNSRHAKPGALLAANVTYSGVAPTTLRATVTVGGQTIPKDFNFDPACVGQPCRIVVPFEAPANMTTGLYPAQLQVEARSGTFTYATSSVVTDTIVVVDRRKSAFGAGWWLDGLESFVHVDATRKLWIGGDGSTRLYTFAVVTGSDSVFIVSPAYDRPDTLRRTSGGYRRLLPNGATVHFNNAGQHTNTFNALGWRTIFTHSTGADSAMIKVSLPVPTGSPATAAYTFTYASDSTGQLALQKVTSPKKATLSPRVLNVNRVNHFTITSFVEARDSSTVLFAYDAAGRMKERRNRLSDTTFFEYDDAGALKLARLSMARTDGAGAAITTTFRSAETRSASSAADGVTLLPKVYSQVDGPRSDVGDSAVFFLNRWGAPDSVVNALNQRTKVSRTNATFPALVTKSTTPGGYETRAHYSSRALVDSTEGWDPYGAGCNGTTNRSCIAVTKFSWHSTWNLPTSIVAPTGEQTSIGYHSSKAAQVWRQRGTDAARRDSVLYNADWQVAATVDPFGKRDSVFYDANHYGNTIKTRSAIGFVTEYVRDSLGRDTLTLTPTDSLQTDSLRVRRYSRYNVMDRIDTTIAVGAAVNYSLWYQTPKDTAAVTRDSVYTFHTYDSEGKPKQTVVTHTKELPNVENSHVRSIENWNYDAAGRTRLHLKNAGLDSTYFDEASNVIRVRSSSGGGYTQTFDALNRVTQRSVAERYYPKERCSGMIAGPITDPEPENLNLCYVIFPAYPNAGDSLRIAANVSTFLYDAAGNLIAADNGDARIRRGYYPNGALRADTSWIREPESQSFYNGRRFVAHSHYDLAGRRDTLSFPDLGFSNPFSYTYATDHGALTTITDLYGTPYRYVYDLAGRIDSLVINNGGVREKRSYDADHRQIARARVAADYSSDETFSLDAQGRIRMAAYGTSASAGYADSTALIYSGLGAVLVRQRTQTNMFNFETEEFRVDGLGNVRRTRGSGLEFPDGQMAQTGIYSHRGQLKGRHAAPYPFQAQRKDTLKQLFDVDGNLLSSHHLVRDQNGNATTDDPTRNYYGADGKLRAVQRYNQGRGVWEEYRYDALGRRVMVIAKRPEEPPACDIAGMAICASICDDADCESKVTDQYWDGDQLIHEKRRQLGSDGIPSLRYGLVYYVNGPELDKPLAVVDGRLTSSARVLNPNWRGTFESSVDVDGEGADCSTVSGGGGFCKNIPWPALGPVYARTPPFETGGGAAGIHTWSGTLLVDGQDGTGNLYRRNRYYDPVAGRFTQEDPIGLAGGMNLYGFAGGDPVNHSDPFGLSPEIQDETSLGQQGPTNPLGGKPVMNKGVDHGEVVYTGMVLAMNSEAPAFRYKVDVAVAGDPDAKATLRMQRQHVKEGTLRTQHFYTGTLTVNGVSHKVRATLNESVKGHVVWGFVEAKPH